MKGISFLKEMYLNNEKWTNRLLWILLVFSLILTLYVQYPLLIDKYKTQNDTRVHVYWMAKFQDNELFEGDFLTTAFIRKFNFFGLPFSYHPQSPGLSFLYYIASFFVSPVFFNKILPFILIVICVFYAFKLGKLIKSNTCGFLLSFIFIVLNLNSFEMFSISQGLQRSFAFPLIIAFLCFLIEKKYVKAAIVTILGLLIYPPISLISFMTYTLSIFHDIRKTRMKLALFKQGIIPLLIVILVGLLLYYPMILKALPKFSEKYTKTPDCQEEIVRNTLKNNPAFGPGGRRIVFSEGSILGIPKYLIIGRGGLFPPGALEFMERNVMPFLFLSFFFLFIVRFDALKLKKETWYLLLSSLIMFAVAWIVALWSSTFVIHFPSRYTGIVLPFFLLLFVSANFENGVRKIFLKKNHILLFFWGIIIVFITLLFSPSFIANHLSSDGFLEPSSIHSLQTMRIVAISIGFIIALLGITMTVFSKVRKLNFNSGYVRNGFLALFVLAISIICMPGIKAVSVISASHAQRELYQFLSTLPKSSYIAGHPDDMENIPIFAKRKVFESSEFLIRGKELIDLFDAYYSTSPKTIRDFSDRNGIDYWVINKKYFSKEYLSRERLFYDPYNEYIIEKTKRQGKFVLSDIPEHKKLFEAGGLFVVKSDSIIYDLINKKR